jgi:hypothetical protein
LVVTSRDIIEALDDLLEHSTPILRSTLGAAPERAGAFEAPFGMLAGPMMGSHFPTGGMTHMMLQAHTEEFIDDGDDGVDE